MGICIEYARRGPGMPGVARHPRTRFSENADFHSYLEQNAVGVSGPWKMLSETDWLQGYAGCRLHLDLCEATIEATGERFWSFEKSASVNTSWADFLRSHLDIVEHLDREVAAGNLLAVYDESGYFHSRNPLHLIAEYVGFCGVVDNPECVYEWGYGEYMRSFQLATMADFLPAFRVAMLMQRIIQHGGRLLAQLQHAVTRILNQIAVDFDAEREIAAIAIWTGDEVATYTGGSADLVVSFDGSGAYDLLSYESDFPTVADRHQATLSASAAALGFFVENLNSYQLGFYFSPSEAAARAPEPNPERRFICHCCGAGFLSRKPPDPERDTGFGTCIDCHPRIKDSWVKHGFASCEHMTPEAAQARLDKYA
jgi:hypothetical protein